MHVEGGVSDRSRRARVRVSVHEDNLHGVCVCACVSMVCVCVHEHDLHGACV